MVSLREEDADHLFPSLGKIGGSGAHVIAIVDYGVGNPGSVANMLLRIDTADGKLTASRPVRDGFTIPTVAIDRSA